MGELELIKFDSGFATQQLNISEPLCSCPKMGIVWIYLAKNILRIRANVCKVPLPLLEHSICIQTIIKGKTVGLDDS